MKKMSKTIAIAALVSVMFASCGLFGGHKGTCPAYSKNNIESFEKTTADLGK
jgi:hypothetical protein